VITKDPNPALTSDSNDNIWQGSTQITSSNISQIYSYQNYLSDSGNPARYDNTPVQNGGQGVFQRRLLSIPIGNCTGTSNGSTTVPVLGFACYFLLQPVTHTGNTDYVIGQFLGNCDVNGTPGPSPASGPGPYIIQLYHDSGSGDS
jgi:hypothetical protein